MEAHSAEDGVLVGRYPTRREATSALWTYLRTGQRVAPSPPKPTAAARRKARLILEGVLDSKRNDARFGVCPQCHRNDGYINVGREHGFFCKQHRANMFNTWKTETEAAQRCAYDELDFDKFETVPWCAPIMSTPHR
jgi:hypothetical protein